MEKRYFYDFALECEYFEWAGSEATDIINGGYLCNHPKQEETYKLHPAYRDYREPPLPEVVGECHCYSCPLGVQDPDDEEKILLEVE
jgi:hypothetical protein